MACAAQIMAQETPYDGAHVWYPNPDTALCLLRKPDFLQLAKRIDISSTSLSKLRYSYCTVSLCQNQVN